MVVSYLSIIVNRDISLSVNITHNLPSGFSNCVIANIVSTNLPASKIKLLKNKDYTLELDYSL